MALSYSKKHVRIIKRNSINHNGDFYCLNCFHSYTTERKLRKHERICKNHDFCYPKMPDEESFYSELNNEHITDEDYAHAQKVWNTFNIKNLGEYHDLHVESDTLLLADVFEMI